ncbi:hypothetical protein AMTR_s01908p00009470, partial [Amborella trichopoda]
MTYHCHRVGTAHSGRSALSSRTKACVKYGLRIRLDWANMSRWLRPSLDQNHKQAPRRPD